MDYSVLFAIVAVLGALLYRAASDYYAEHGSPPYYRRVHAMIRRSVHRLGKFHYASPPTSASLHAR
jgi:hypothetical protein